MVRLSTGGYLEITFFGTGLNLLSYADGYAYTAYATVDGGTESVTNIYPVTSNILASRGYGENCVFPVSTTSLGVHTVKIRNASGADILVFGFEILNATSGSNYINLNTGTAYIQGQKVLNSIADSVLYNAGVTGAKGGRVVRYLKDDGTVSQAVTLVDASTNTLTNANHTNEEVVRTYHWREFGAGRADDFSTLAGSASDRAFTLDDGTTTLVCYQNAVSVATGQIALVSNGGFITFTFVGCGLDLVIQDTPSGGADTYQYSIDGGTLTAWSNTSGNTTKRTQKVVSGLPYGTHTFKLYRSNAVTWVPTIHQFIVYQPKKPTIPATAVELCDYNVMGSFAANTTADVNKLSAGVLRKNCSREIVYVGTTWGLSLDAVNDVAGFACGSNSTNKSVSYTFFGTGFDLRWQGFTDRVTAAPVTLNGTALNASYPGGSGISCSVAGTGVTFGGQSGTFLLSAVSSNNLRQATSSGAIQGCSFSVSGLPLGVYTLLISDTTSGYIVVESLDIITPIHAVKSSLYADPQNALPVGSCSLTDSRKTSVIKEIPPEQSWDWVKTTRVSVQTNPITPIAASTQDGNVYSGTYTPVITSILGVTVNATRVAQFLRVGKVVTVSGGAAMQFADTTDRAFKITTPITRASNFPSGGEGAAGIGVASRGGGAYSGLSGTMYGMSNEKTIRWDSSVGGADINNDNHDFTFTFTYTLD